MEILVQGQSVLFTVN